MLFDTHSHPYYAQKKSQEEILERFFAAENRRLISVGIDIESSQKSIEIGQNYQHAFASIGIHPVDALKYRGNTIEILSELEEMYRNNTKHIVAIGEAGLDYYWAKSLSNEYNISIQEVMQIQKDFFRAQIRLANKLALPLIIHNRESARDIFEILREENVTNFVFHCYSENLEFAEKLLTFAPECMLGFGGIVTFKNAKEVQEAAKNIPLKNILIETDSPYLTPTPYRGKEENEQLYTQYVLEKIIELREESPEKITKTLYENSLNFFGID